MTLCHYSDVLKLVAQLCGLDYAPGGVGSFSGLDSDTESQLRVILNSELQQLWPLARWPDLQRCEQRSLRQPWTAAGFSEGAQVFYLPTGLYYVAIRAAVPGTTPADVSRWGELTTTVDAADYAATTTYVAGDRAKDPLTGIVYQSVNTQTGVDVTDPTSWGEVPAFNPYVAKDQAWEENVIGTFYDAWPLDPRLTTRQRPLNTFESANGLQFLGFFPSRPWIEYQIPVPELKGEPWVLLNTYAVGEQIQFETALHGVCTIDFYNCITATFAGEDPSNTAAKWSRVEIPDAFKTYLGARTAEVFLTGEEDGRLAVASSMAERALAVLMDELYRVRGQIPRTRVRSY